jgi:hypothetical protein
VAEGRDAGAKWRLRSPSHPIAPARTRDPTDSQFRWVKGVGKGWVGNEKEEGDGCNPFLDRAERTQFELEVRRCVRSVTHARTHARPQSVIWISEWESESESGEEGGVLQVG